MQTNWGLAPLSIGFLIALVVLVVVVALAVTDQLDVKLAFMIGGLAVARMT